VAAEAAEEQGTRCWLRGLLCAGCECGSSHETLQELAWVDHESRTECLLEDSSYDATYE
jgi:hypothetical protein